MKAILIFLLIFPTFVYADQPRSTLLRPHHYTMQEGLIFDKVNNIAQDRYGFIWIATEDGLSRFDGKTFQNIKYDAQSTTGLAGNYIAQLHTDAHGDLWVTSRNGISKYDANKESFAHYQILTTSKGRYKTDVSSVSSTAEADELWISANGLGLYRFNQHTGNFKRYNTENLLGLSSNMVTSVLEDSRGLLWIGTQDAGVQVFSVTPNEVLLHETLKKLQDDNRYARVHHIYEDNSKRIWVATDNGLLLYEPQTGQRQWFNAQQLGLPSNRFLSIASNTPTQIYIGLQDGGVYRFNLTQKYHTIELNRDYFISDANQQEELTQRSVSSLFFDRDSNLWIGTSGDGVFLASKPKYHFENFQHANFLTTEEIKDVRFYGLSEDSIGNLFVGTDGHGVFKFNRNNQLIKRYVVNDKSGSITDNAILYGYCDRKGRMWFGTYNGGLLLYRPLTDNFLSYRFNPNEEGFLGGNDVRVIYEDRRGQLWVGTNGGGLNKLNETTGKFSRYLQNNSGIPSNDIRAIAEDKEGHLIIGTYGAGITFFDPEKEQFGLLPADELYERLASEVVYALQVSLDDKLWIATESSGLLVYDLSSRQIIQHYNERNGLASNTVFSIKFDSNFQCWVSTNKGLSQITIKTGQVFNYGPSSGIQPGIFNPNSAHFSASRKQLFFGGTGGLTYFDPQVISSKAAYKPVTLTRLEIFGEKINVGEPTGHPILQQALNEITTITLKPSQSTFTLHYSSLDYGYADEINFAYKLDGLEDNWNWVKGDHAATYRYLPPGRYTFQAGIAHGGELLTSSIKTVKIIVLPPWHKTWWAYLAYLTIVCAVVYYYYRYRKQREDLKYQLAITQIEHQKEKEWNELKINFYTRLSHEFRSSLTLILNPVKDLLQSGPTRQLEPYVNTLHANTSRLLRLADQALNIRKDDLIMENILWEELDVVQLANDVINCFTNQAAKKDIAITLNAADERLCIHADREKLEIILFNLIFNAVKFTTKGKICIDIKWLDDALLEISVADTGCGIADSMSTRLFEPFSHSPNGDHYTSKSYGVGLWMVKSLVELHQGQITYQSERGHGTKFTVHLPQNKRVSNLPNNDAQHQTLTRKIMKTPKSQKILLMDDDLQLVIYLKSLFEEEYEVWLTDNQAEALTIVEHELPDIILCDVMLGNENGIDFCSTIRGNASWKHIPIILITAAKGTDIQINGIERGADDFLAKPFDKGVLLAKVKALLQRGKNLQEYFLNNITDSMGYQKVSSEDKVLLDKCISIIEQHLEDDHFSVHVLADQCGMTYATLSNRIKEINQQTLSNLIRTVRLHKAAQLLLTTDNTVYEVAYKVGIRDLKYFREQFAKVYALNPSDFVRKYRKPFHEIHHPN